MNWAPNFWGTQAFCVGDRVGSLEVSEPLGSVWRCWWDGINYIFVESSVIPGPPSKKITTANVY